MRRRRPIAIATAAALATICAGAAAKEIDTVSICGADGCRAVTDERLLALLAEGGPRHHGAVAPAEHFVARVRIVHRGAGAYGFKTTVLPAAGLVRGDDGTWMELPHAAQDAYEQLTRGRDPLPASAMSGGSVVDPPPAAARPAAPAAAGDGLDGLPWPWLAAAAAVALSAAAVRRARRRPAST